MPVPQANRNDTQPSLDDILDRAEHQHITLHELDFLVLTLRQLSTKRRDELRRLQALLLELESRRHPRHAATFGSN